MGANQAADPRERVVFANQFHRFPITPLTDQAYVTGDIDARRTGHLAGRWSEDVTITRWTVVSFDVAFVYLPVMDQSLGGNSAEPNPVLVFSFQKKVGQGFHGSKVL
jgi:hypothetical protein